MKKAKSDNFVHPPFKIGWHDFIFTLPKGWEVTSYSMRQEDGAMGFADESGALGQITWRKVKAVPDREKIMGEIHRRYLADNDPEREMHFDELNFVKGNEVIMGYDVSGQRFYASAFLEHAKLLVEWTFPEYSAQTAKTVLPMLKSFRPNLPDDDGNLFYGCFGLEITLPGDYRLESITAIPAAITMEFENKKHHRILAHRWGMPDLLLEGGSLQDYYHRFLSNKCRYVVKEINSADFFAMEGVETEFRTRGRFGFDFLLGPWWKGRGTACYDKDEMRIYALEHISPKRKKVRLSVKDVFGEKHHG